MASPTQPATHPVETNDGIVTSWLPVTSAWPSIPVCSAAIYTQLGTANGLHAIAFDPIFGEFINTDLSCLPPFATSWWQQPRPTPALTVTSIGPLVCPGLYTTASSSILNSLSTFIACCPSEYDFQSTAGPGVLGQCNSPLTVGQTLIYATQNLTQAWTTSSAVISAVGASVFGVPVNGYIFASTTTPLASSSTSHTSSSLSSTAPITTSISAASSTSLSLAPETASSSPVISTHLAPGAKAGIGVSVTLAIIGLCCVAGAFFFMRRRKQRKVAADGQERELTLASSPKNMCWEDGHGFDPVPKQTFEMWELPCRD